MRKAPGMPAPLTSHQRNLFMAQRRGGSSQEAAAAAAGISVRSARRIESNQLQPQANQPRGRTRADPLAGQLHTKARENRIWPVRRPLEAAAAASRVRGGKKIYPLLPNAIAEQMAALQGEP